MRKRQVGNYLKQYPHVYEAFRKNIGIKNVARGLLIVLLVILAFFALVFWLMGNAAGGMFFVMLLTVPVIMFAVSGRSGMISREELELMERDLAGEKEKVRDWGYSMKESFMIGFCRIPRKGLTTVYLGKEVRGRSGLVAYTWEFYYEDGTHLSAELLKAPEASDEEEFARLIRKYDDGVKIYRHRKMEEREPLYCPFQKFIAEEPFVKGSIIAELTELDNKNLFWRLGAKSRNRYNGNTEVELTLYGTALTWLLYLAWICLTACFFFYSLYIQSEVLVIAVFLGSGLCYCLGFIRSSRKMIQKAKACFYGNNG